MKRQNLKHLPLKARIGILVFVAFAGLGIVSGITEQRRYDAQLAASNQADRKSVERLKVAEKSKIAMTKTDVVVVEEEVPFTTTETLDATLPKDTIVVRVEGSKGKKITKTEVKTKDGIEISRSLISEDIIVPPVAKIVAIGTKVVDKPVKKADRDNCDPNYKPCVPNSTEDLDCDDIGFRVAVVGRDVHNFDEEDNNGVGCERYAGSE